MSEYSLSALEVSGHFSVRMLLHAFPTSSHMFRNLIPALAEEYHVPIMPGFPSFVPTVPNHYHVVESGQVHRPLHTDDRSPALTPFTCLNTGRNQRRSLG